jgi:hypothetical protein
MMCEIEFFRVTPENPEGATARRDHGYYVSLTGATKHGLADAGPDTEEIDGFRIYVAGFLKKTVILRPWNLSAVDVSRARHQAQTMLLYG